MRPKTALIVGVTGQDGSYLAEHLLSQGYIVHGIVRRASTFNTDRIEHLYIDPHDNPGTGLTLHYGDLTDAAGLRSVLSKVCPTEVYNLGAQSHVRVSFDQPVYTFDVNATGALSLFEAVRDHQDTFGQEVRIYQASSSEMFGSEPPPQNEHTEFRPQSPYACAKVAAYHLARNYRESYGMFIANGILFNHESPRRGETFVTRKITRAATRIKMGLQAKLFLGNLDAKRDWGFAGEYMVAAHAMLQQDKPDDYVIGTGQMSSVRQFLDLVFSILDLRTEAYVEFDPRYLRPREVDALQADPSKAVRDLGWEPKTTLPELAKMMVSHDLYLARQEAVNGAIDNAVKIGNMCRP